MIRERRRRPWLGAAAAAILLSSAVAVVDPFGRGGGGAEVEVVTRDAVTTTSTTTAPVPATTLPATATTRAPAPRAPVAPALPPPDTAGPSLSVSQQDDCWNTFNGSNTITATASDPSGVASVTLSASGLHMTSPSSQAMSPSGASTYAASIGWNSGPTTISWTVTARDAIGNTSASSGSFVVQTSPC